MSEKIAVVTGASRGIGRAIACRLASEGIRVIINYNGSVEQAEQVQRQIREAGGQAEISSAMWQTLHPVKRLFQMFLRHGDASIFWSIMRESRGTDC